jgi:hypothetical protein
LAVARQRLRRRQANEDAGWTLNGSWWVRMKWMRWVVMLLGWYVHVGKDAPIQPVRVAAFALMRTKTVTRGTVMKGWTIDAAVVSVGCGVWQVC